MNKASRTSCNGICNKSRQLQFVDFLKMVYSRYCMEYFNLRITKCGYCMAGKVENKKLEEYENENYHLLW